MERSPAGHASSSPCLRRSRSAEEGRGRNKPLSATGNETTQRESVKWGTDIPRPPTEAGSTTAQGKAYDAIVIGGGHNGLLAAAYLGRAGRGGVAPPRGAPARGGGG